MADEIASIRARLAAISSESAPIVPVVEEEKNNNEAAKEDKPDDEKSIFVGQLDPSSITEEKLQAFFGSCGQIKKIYIKRDPYTHRPKGYAFIEFMKQESVQNAMSLNDKLLCGKNVKVLPKRENKPGMSRRPRGPPRRFRK